MMDYEYNPESGEAVDCGCTCPVLDNNHGDGYLGTDRYVVNLGCPLHGIEMEADR